MQTPKQNNLPLRLLVFLIIVGAIIIGSNIYVLAVTSGKCYDSVAHIPHSTYGILLGTGRSADSSPYYDARVQSAIELYNAGKIDFIYISGKNNNQGFNEVKEMANELEKVVPPRYIMLDYNGTDTWTSLDNFGDLFGYRSSVTIISQEFHNQRAVFLGSFLFFQTPIAYNAEDMDNIWWKIRNIIRECFARTNEVLMLPIRM